MDSALKDFIHEFNSQGYHIECASIFKNGQLLGYVGNDKRVNVHSCGKTITALAYGIAAQEVGLSADDIVVEFFPEYKRSAFRGTEHIRIKDLLHMSSGKKLRSVQDARQQENWCDDWLAWFFEAPTLAKAGSDFYYSSHCCYTIGRIIEKKTGQSVNEFLQNKLWLPLGIRQPKWAICPQGHTICAGNIWLHNSDLAKIGHLILNKGKYGGQQIINAEFIQQMISDVVKSVDPFQFDDPECACGYGYFLWKCRKENTYRIWGAGGNICVIDYERQICVTTTAKTDLNKWRYNLNDANIVRSMYFLIDTVRQDN
ncbi:MAG: serine hydrolase [Nitrososphaerota archaeon]|nr:serine hydrolase [Nitrososphaerota archaeon]